MTINWIQLLEKNGDDIERLSISKYEFHRIFPKYAEFCGRYVHSNILKDFEVAFIYHYSILYHLVASRHTTDKVNEFTLLNIGAPFSHLATAADLTQRVFLEVLRKTAKVPANELTEEQFTEKVTNFWSKNYTKEVSTFNKKFGRPVQIQLHSAEILFEEHVVNKNDVKFKEFTKVVREVRQYRNNLVHDRAPMKVFVNDKVHIPKIDKLLDYKNRNWLDQPKPDQIESDYVVADKLLTELNTKFVQSLNSIWDVLIDLMPIDKMPERDAELKHIYERMASYNPSGTYGSASGVVIDKSPGGID